MVKWSELKRSSDVILAIWPYYSPLHDRWFMKELAYKADTAPVWRERYIPDADGTVQSDHYPDRESALAAANSINPSLHQIISTKVPNATLCRSLEMKADKALQCKKRLQAEEYLMLGEAIRRHEKNERIDSASLKMAPASEQYRSHLAEQLLIMPYLRMALVIDRPDRRLPHGILYLEPDGTWSKPYYASVKALSMAERSKIANGFGFSATSHWGKTKATIRQILLPRANQLLQLASVQRLLAEAAARGERALVSNGIVFWYEDDQIGWQIKSTSATNETEGTAIWKEGTILSINHGRIVVLPYIKENGEGVRGHTKNAPNDGRAFPRHPDHYVEIPFSLYDEDLMIGLFGELPYE